MTRVLLAKPGLDGHDRGIKVIALALRDRGAEVIYLGLRRSASQIMSAAADEDVDVVGVSILSGAHLTLGRRLIEERRNRGLDDVPLVIGGTIPRSDAELLLAWGAAAVFPVGSNLPEVADAILDMARQRDRLAN